MEVVFAILAICILGAVLVGALLGFVSTLRINSLERTIRDLRLRLEAFESGATPPGPAESPPSDASGEASSVGPTTESPAVEVIASEPLSSEPQASEPRASEPLISQAGRPEAAPERPKRDLESMVAGRWLNRVGIVAVLIATAFFLKLAIDNQWIGPLGRVLVGLVAGVALLAASHWLLRRGYSYFSEGITALGGGVLFLALYAAWAFYQLVEQPIALLGMVATTVVLAWIARTRSSERLAGLALGAGLLAPALLFSDETSHVTLFTYLAILLAAFLVLAWRQTWRTLAPLALLGLLLHGVPWFIDQYSPAIRLSTLAFAALFFGGFLAYSVLTARHGRGLDLREVFLPVVNGAWFGWALYATLFDDFRWGLTLAVFAAGALLLTALALIGEREDRAAQSVRVVLGGLALSYFTATVPIRLEGSWITIAWAVEAAALVWAGFEARLRPLRAAGFALFLPVLVLLTTQSEPTRRLFLNERFASFLAVAVGLAVSAALAKRHQDKLGPNERILFPALGVVAVAVGVWGLSVELWYGLGRWDLTADLDLTRQLGLSLLWVLAASLLIGLGLRRDSKLLRLEGLALLGLTIVKVFLSDLSFLDNVYRIASFLVLGVVLLLVSFRYQRGLGGREE